MLAEVYRDRYGDRCPHREPWLTDVAVEEVLDDVLDLLGDPALAEPPTDVVRLTGATDTDARADRRPR
jgi:hypothetical protein